MDIIFERNIKIEVDNAIKKAIKDYENIDSIDPIKYIGCYTREDVTEVLETYIGDCKKMTYAIALLAFKQNKKQSTF